MDARSGGSRPVINPVDIPLLARLIASEAGEFSLAEHAVPSPGPSAIA